jgi:polyisoprenoid-binding protein YceI
MRKTLFLPVILLVLIAIITACAPGAPAPAETMTFAPIVVNETEKPVETAPVVAETPLLVEATEATDQLAVTASPAETESSSQLVVYKIVPGESKATYEVGETFFNQNNRFNLAVGVTPQISGEVRIDMSDPRKAEIGEIKVDISQFQSDSGRRDNAIRGRWLESSTYPMAVFKPTSIEELPETASEGQEISFKVNGELTVKQTTLPVTFDVTAKLENDTLTGTAATTILLSQFGVGPISIGGMLETEDQAKLKLEFIARPQ